MLFLAALTFEIAKLIKIDPVPLIIAEVVIANTGGAATLIGDPPNVILGTQLGLGFNAFIVNNAPIAIVATLVSMAVLYTLNKKSLAPTGPLETDKIKEIKPREAITDRWALNRGLAALILAIALLTTHE